MKVREQHDEEDRKGSSLLPLKDDSGFPGICCFRQFYSYSCFCFWFCSFANDYLVKLPVLLQSLTEIFGCLKSLDFTLQLIIWVKFEFSCFIIIFFSLLN